jgi:2-oxoisovalerate dehydrogenase E1 component alpha subunit
LKDWLKKDVMRAFKHAESLKRHELKELFSDVYEGEEPLNLVGVPRSYPSPFPFLGF